MFSWVLFLRKLFSSWVIKKTVHLFFLLVLNFLSPFLRRPPSRSPMKISKKNKKLVSTFSGCRHCLHELCSYLSRTLVKSYNNFAINYGHQVRTKLWWSENYKTRFPLSVRVLALKKLSQILDWYSCQLFIVFSFKAAL